jgi:hypothetical protein
MHSVINFYKFGWPLFDIAEYDLKLRNERRKEKASHDIVFKRSKTDTLSAVVITTLIITQQSLSK